LSSEDKKRNILILNNFSSHFTEEQFVFDITSIVKSKDADQSTL
jgi:hypothetical protein